MFIWSKRVSYIPPVFEVSYLVEFAVLQAVHALVKRRIKALVSIVAQFEDIHGETSIS